MTGGTFAPGLLLALALTGPSLCLAAAAAEEDTFAAVLQLLASRRHGHVAFTEVQRLSMLDEPLRSSGELLYDAPDRLEKRTLEPRSEDLLFDRGVLTIERGHHRRSVALRDLPQAAPFIESLRATLGGDRASLERYFTIHFSGSTGQWRLELAPKDPALQRSVQRILISGEHDRIRSVEIRASDGDTSILSIGADLTP